ncbi:MAG: HAMP domain-containing histidine kinase [Nannocystis sp.]|nr:HAMP domain-containing sensor histidine kinase [Nannocystis sp.]MBA3548190.1 HAMP domain-containing histidine kinase [Nannocystis sp.]
MVPDSKPSTERVQTDAALRAERINADRALAAERAAVDADVDRVVHLARDDADAKVSAAREHADHAIEQVDSVVEVTESVAELRAVEDEALANERATVDEILRLEREHARALSALLPLERDRTDRQLHIERSRSDAAVAHRDGFLGMVSHDLRNLLSGILLSAELLARQAATDVGGAQTLTNVDRIRRYTARMNRLIGDLVDVTSIDAGKLSITPTTGDPATVISEAVELFRVGAASARVSLETRVAAGSLRVQFDHDRLLQVLANLIANAIKFTPAGGSIVVEGVQQGDHVRIAVTDSGAGIPPHLLERIFERFWQVGAHDSRGMGLGLYISRSLIEAHGGKIWAESRLGSSCTVFFTLPVA